ncbi:hypothetical protein ES703_43351 [subsurface metagenome]
MTTEEKVRTIYNAVCDVDFDLPVFEEWVRTIKIFHETETGGLAFNEDEKELDLWWMNIFCPGSLPKTDVLKWLILLCKEAGCRILATEAPIRAAGRILRMVGFQDLGDNLYALRLN